MPDENSCTSSDLVNIPQLALSDTFNTWFDRTNQVIEAVNAVNIFDIAVGSTNGGIDVLRGCSGDFYTGVPVLSIASGAGIGVGTPAFTDNYNRVVVDVANLSNLGGNTGTNPEVDDYFIVSDISDTRQGSSGTPKRISARRILPSTIEFGTNGTGTLTIEGNLNIKGDFVIEGEQSTISSANLGIQDKVINLAYNQYAELTVVRKSAGSLTAGTFSVGMTAFYIDSGVPTAGNATTIGEVAFWQSGSGGTTGTVRIASFAKGGVTDFEAIPNGDLVITGGGYLGVLDVTGSILIGDSLITDTNLNEAGISIKGFEGNKNFLWLKGAPVGASDWNSFMSNANLGVSGGSGRIISSKFASYGYADSSANNTFTYFGLGNSYTKYSVGSTLVMEHSPTGSAAGTTFGIVNMGSTGPNVLSGVPVYNWIRYFNADQLDGAHAVTGSVPWSIPIMGADGRLNANQVNADSIRRTFTVVGHAFSKGDVLRFNSSGSLTFASASGPATSEAIGMVDAVSGNNITVITEGFISSLSGTRINAVLPLVTGNVYYLSATTPGGLIANPDAAPGITVGAVQKEMLLAAGSNSGYVLNSLGIVKGNPTDLLFMSSFTPVGSIHPFAGPVTSMPDGWLPCDGRRLAIDSYSDLYAAIGNSHHADGTKNASNDRVTMAGDTRGMAIGDNVLLSWVSGFNPVQANAVVASVDTVNKVVQFTFATNQAAFNALVTGTAIKVYGRVDGTGTSVMFIPDLRRRTLFGSSVGDGITGGLSPSLPLGDAAGSNVITLGQSVSSVGSGAFASTTSTVPSLPPYVAINWMIRTKKGVEATVLTGHNHDLRYVRYNGDHTIAGGAANTLTAGDRATFRNNVRALGDGRDGAAVFGNTLTITGGITGGLSVFGNLLVSGDSNIAGLLDVSEARAAVSTTGGSNSSSLVTKNYVDALVPIGTIVVWGGLVTNIPTGWALCDGGTYNDITTPDLRGRFILGAVGASGSASPLSAGTFSAGSVGGAKTISFTMPNHRHGLGLASSNYTNDDLFFIKPTNANLYTTTITYNLAGVFGEGNSPGSGVMYAGTHNNSSSPILVTTKAMIENIATGTFTEVSEPTIGITGSDGNNLPNYYTLCYIMKVSGAQGDNGGFTPTPPPCNACDEITTIKGQIAGLTAQDIVLNNQMLGMNQSWTAFTGAERANGTTYTNNTIKPINVLIGVTKSTTASRTLTVVVNGVTILTLTHGGGAQGQSTSFIVPPGHTYRVSLTGDGSIATWAELR